MKFTICIVHVIVVIWIMLVTDSVGQSVESTCPEDGVKVNVCKDDGATNISMVYLDTSSAPTFEKAACKCSMASVHPMSVTASFATDYNPDTITILFVFPSTNLTWNNQYRFDVKDKPIEFWYRSRKNHRTYPACLKLSVPDDDGNINQHFNVSCQRSVRSSSTTPTTQTSSFVGKKKPESNYVPTAIGASAGVLLIAAIIAAAIIFIKRRRNKPEETPNENYDHKMENQMNTIANTKQGIDDASDDNYKENKNISDTYTSVGYESADDHSGINPVEGTFCTKAADGYYSTVSKDRNRNVKKKSDTSKHDINVLGTRGNDEQAIKTHTQHCINAAFDGSSDVYNHLNEKVTVQPANVYGRLTTDADHPKDFLNEYDHIRQSTEEVLESKDETYDSAT
ncbi:uncharacterized protein LOC128236968 [Mya arenaria]|uniref:uncharacterized protein LOC128236968 n=1 Tax=Mya arenaria TaxID=6604 RepID=UPI0022E441CC|nr:uncharacterized protein LOC128236968 [Mya arenaria]